MNKLQRAELTLILAQLTDTYTRLTAIAVEEEDKAANCPENMAAKTQRYQDASQSLDDIACSIDDATAGLLSLLGEY